ncbi:unnamed protein product [Clonostachys byssicola]|uniref:Uncharacterized protein n=1 Tax=Clonostachys byssicola TaxID=160290 RepID=A0A9N9XZI2_9HYPO|nr:unnamed protein product [Clonostachys byssicola]
MNPPTVLEETIDNLWIISIREFRHGNLLISIWPRKVDPAESHQFVIHVDILYHECPEDRWSSLDADDEYFFKPCSNLWALWSGIFKEFMRLIEGEEPQA